MRNDNERLDQLKAEFEWEGDFDEIWNEEYQTVIDEHMIEEVRRMARKQAEEDIRMRSVSSRVNA